MPAMNADPPMSWVLVLAATEITKTKNEIETGEATMTSFKNFAAALGLMVPLALGATAASAEDQLKMVIGQINNWENQAPTLGQDAGIFKKHNLKVEAIGTSGAGETIQAVISGSADLGAGVGLAGAMRAYSKGAPVRVLLPAFTGTGDIYWYVRSDSPIKTLKDATDKTTIAYSTSGSSSNNIVLGFVKELGTKGVPTKTGGPAATLTAVMSGQVDIGWSAPPFGLQEEKDGKLRIIARGSDVPSLRGQTVRTIIVNADALKNKRDAIMRFVDAYRESVDWMYSDPKAIAMYAKKIKRTEDLIKGSVATFHPKPSMQTDAMAELDEANKSAVLLKFLEKPLTKAQLAEFIVIPPRKK
jgi:NitT/TauT family transport system substrate-binding protein